MIEPAHMIEVLRGRGYTRAAAEAMVREAKQLKKSPGESPPPSMAPPTEFEMARAKRLARQRGLVVPKGGGGLSG